MSKWRKSYELLYGSNLSDTHRSLVTPALHPNRKKSSNSGLESERKVQQRLVAWMREEKILHFAVPNGANVSPHHRQTLLSEGMSPGINDLVIPVARHGFFGLFLELKREDGGAGLSAAQKGWQKNLREQGYCAVQCNGYQAAKECVQWYLSGDDLSAIFLDIVSSFLNLWRITKKSAVATAPSLSPSCQTPSS